MMLSNPKKTVLITGAAGFLGRNIARKFSESNYSVTGVGHSSWDDGNYSEYGIQRWIESDVTYDSLCAIDITPNYIVHCAGGGSVSFSLTNPHEDFTKTVSSVAGVLEYIRTNAPAAKLIYPSSAAVYGNVDNSPIKESHSVNPTSPYGAHKMMAENLCKLYAEHYRVSVAIIRFFSLYGEGLKKQLLWDACNKIVRNDYQFYGSGEEIRDWLHINDAVELLWKIKEHVTSDVLVVNGGTGQGATVKEILTALFEIFKVSNVPEFTQTIRSGDPISLIADINTSSTLGWKSEKDWYSGLQEYANWFKSIDL